jgi:deoxyribodipyrimidine photolyase-related protein
MRHESSRIDAALFQGRDAQCVTRMGTQALRVALFLFPTPISPPPIPVMRTLVFLLRDQLDRSATVLDDLDPAQDAVAMTEADTNRGRYTEHVQQLVLGLSAMRHVRNDLRERGLTVHYQTADADAVAEDAADFLRQQVADHQPERVAITEPGRLGLLDDLQAVCDAAGVPLDVHADNHFLVTHDTFEQWADGRKELTMEYFYREQRRAYDVLLTEDGDPVGGDWNFDDDNRESFGADGPGMTPDPITFDPDAVTQDAIETVRAAFPDAPGSLDSFGWPVTPEQARASLDDFIEHRLPMFGTYQDAMWTGRPFLYHSRLSAALNLKLLDPRTVIEAAEQAYHDGHAPINAVEGFIRQVLGWREFVRGVYFLHGGAYVEKNALDATADIPDFYWTGDTQMRCLSECAGQVAEHAYTHHIPRLMVLGLFGLLYGVDPQQMNAWHEAMYVDAWEWVSAPNMIGMALYADGGIVGSKPYTASGKYIGRMSNYCQHCVYDKGSATGEDACPFTTLYWNFLDRHQDALSGNRRMNFQLANVRRKSDAELDAIADRVDDVRDLVERGEL